jgi:hypothetical protein
MIAQRDEGVDPTGIAQLERLSRVAGELTSISQISSGTRISSITRSPICS